MKLVFNVVQTVEVELDESKFDQEYLDAFSEVMFGVDDISELGEYIARNKALYPEYDVEFVPKDWFSANVIDEYVEEN